MTVNLNCVDPGCSVDQKAFGPLPLLLDSVGPGQVQEEGSGPGVP